MSKNFYPPANKTVQSFAQVFIGDLMNTNCCCLHTTEGFSWPSYSGGSVAPNITGKPRIRKKKLAWRQHYPANRSSRALVNEHGGVETNTMNVFQVELVGTCDPAHRKRWGSKVAGRDYIYWPEAPDWALKEVADLLKWLHRTHSDFRLVDGAPRGWLPYPDSYGNNNGQRMSNHEWLNFYGVCGHQHVPENYHGDPGNIDITKIISFATDGQVDTRPGPSEPRKKPETRVTRAREHFRQGLNLLTDAVTKQHRVGAVKKARNRIRYIVRNVLPPR